jgi:quinol monooxygenase YgiN
VSLIAVEAAITFPDRAARDAAIEATVAIQQATREKPGCIVYCFAADPCRDDVIQVYELWESEAALAAHFHHPTYLDMRARLKSFGILSAPSRKHRIDATAPVYDEHHVPSASFD